MATQENWRFCQKCEAMFFDGYAAKGVCTAGGGHLSEGYNFELAFDMPESASAQAQWRFCSKCFVMFYDGFPDKGHCSAGGGHTFQGWNFTLPHDIPASANSQPSWSYCGNCHAMFYNGFSAKGLCPGNRETKPGTVLPGHGGGSFFGGHTAAGFNFVLPYQTAVPSGPPLLSFMGAVWIVSLTHEQSEAVEGVLGAIAAAAGPTPGIGAIIAAIVGGVAGTILVVDAMGGDQGVDVQGVLGVTGFAVTPHGSGIVQTLIEGARIGVAATQIVGFILQTGSAVPAIGSSLGISTAAGVFSAVEAGTPLGWALAAGAGLVVDLLQPAPDPNAHGGIHADRAGPPGDWERFIMTQVAGGTQIALLAWQGLFSAQNGGGGDVYANRPQVGPWETWNIIDNHDGTVSFQTNSGGYYLTATNGGGNGSYCLASATAIGPSERFILENQSGGHIALRTQQKGTYLSVQPGK